MAKRKNYDEDDGPVVKPDYSNLPNPLKDWKSGNDYLLQSAARWGNKHNPHEVEAMRAVGEAILAGKPPPAPGAEVQAPPNGDAEDRALAKAWVAQGWLPHHEGGGLVPVASFEEALIIARYRRSLKEENLSQTPFFLKFESEEEGATLDKWLSGDKSTQSPKGGPNPYSFEAKSYASPGFSGLNYNTMSVDDD
jgi:hypothetical protein